MGFIVYRSRWRPGSAQARTESRLFETGLGPADPYAECAMENRQTHARLHRQIARPRRVPVPVCAAHIVVRLGGGGLRRSAEATTSRPAAVCGCLHHLQGQQQAVRCSVLNRRVMDHVHGCSMQAMPLYMSSRVGQPAAPRRSPHSTGPVQDGCLIYRGNGWRCARVRS